MATLPEDPVDDDAESSSNDLTPEEEKVLSRDHSPTPQAAFTSACIAAHAVGQAWMMD